MEKVIVADFDSSSMDRLREKVGETGDRLSFEKVDVKDHSTTASLLAGCDIVINAVQYYFNLDVMAAALAAGVHYLDFGGLYHTTLEQMKQFGDKFREKGLLAIAGMGAQPGISNLMVKYALESLDAATSVEIFDGWRDFTKSDSPMYFTWSPQTFFDESSLEAVIFKNGKYETRPAFSEPQKVKFPSPVGEVDVFLSLHSELATIPHSFASYGVKNLVWKEGGADFWKIKLLADLGLTSNQKISVDGMEIAPRRFFLKLLESKNLVKIQEDVVPNDYEITRVVAKGTKDGKKKSVIVDAHFPPYKPWRASCNQYNVGIPGSIAAQWIASEAGELPRGVLPAEQVFEPLKFFRELEKRKIRIRKRLALGN